MDKSKISLFRKGKFRNKNCANGKRDASSVSSEVKKVNWDDREIAEKKEELAFTFNYVSYQN